MSCPLRFPTCHRETEKDCPTRESDGTPTCTLGLSSIPVSFSKGYTTYELVPTDSSAVKVRLSATHRAYIKFIVERGGEVVFDEGANITPEALAHINILVQDMKIIDRIPAVGTTRVYHKITPFGAKVATAVLKQGA